MHCDVGAGESLRTHLRGFEHMKVELESVVRTMAWRGCDRDGHQWRPTDWAWREVCQRCGAIREEQCEACAARLEAKKGENIDG